MIAGYHGDGVPTVLLMCVCVCGVCVGERGECVWEGEGECVCMCVEYVCGGEEGVMVVSMTFHGQNAQTCASVDI